jgi:UDPglucose 6-dehydrogenase
MSNQFKKIGFIGLGKLGLPCAEAMAKSYNVVGYDIYPKTSDKITVSDTLQDAIYDADIIFVAVQTPHDPIYDGSQPITHLPNKDFDYTIANQVLADINQHAQPDQLVVLISTVLPGTTRRELRKNITNARFIYNPYLIAMGSVAWDMVNPEMVIIGTEDGSLTGDAQLLKDFYTPLMENNPRYAIGTWDEAEAIKIFYNTFISTKIGLVNMIQDVAMKNGNMNVDIVTDALSNATLRIVSKKYMKAGMGDAGPCHPRDNIALRYLAQSLNLGYDIFDTVMHAREKQAENLAKYLIDIQNFTNMPIIIHGKAYKPDVDILDGSYSLLIGSYLEKLGSNFMYYDPLTGDTLNNIVPSIILLAHNRQITYGYIGINKAQTLYFTPEPGSIIVDPWRTYEAGNEKVLVMHYGNSRNSWKTYEGTENINNAITTNN